MPVEWPEHPPHAFIEEFMAEVHRAWERCRTQRNREAHLVIQLRVFPREGQKPWDKEVRYVG